MTKKTTLPSQAILHTASRLAHQFAKWGAETHAIGGYPEREAQALREAGLLHVTLPGEALDMEGGYTLELLQLLKLVGRGNLALGRIYEGHVNALLLIHLYATPEQRRRWYREVRAGHLFGVWNTEAADGVNLYLRPDHSVRVKGSKTFCSGADHVTRPLITGHLHGLTGKIGGWQMAIVDLDENDIPVDPTFWTPLGMQESVSFKLDFSQVVLQQRHLLGKPDDYQVQPSFSGGAIRFAAVQLGAAEALFDATRAFLRHVRRTENTQQQMRLGEMAIAIESGNLWLDQSARLTDAGGDKERITTYANMVRTTIKTICTQTLQLATQCVGARGMMHPLPFARLHTDLTMYLCQPAPDAVLTSIGSYHAHLEKPVHDLWSRRP